MTRRRIIPVFVPHAGCPNACVFCDQRRISGRVQTATAETVRQALSCLEPGAEAEIAFYGGSFTALPPAEQECLLSAVQPFRAEKYIRAIRLSTRPDAIDDEALDRLSFYGVETVELGAQSMSEHVLKLSGRGHTAEDVRRASGQIKSAGFQLILQMMTGLPGSDDESDLETGLQLAELRPDGVRIYPTVIVRGTKLEEMWRSGQYREHSVEDAVRVCAKIVPIFDRAGIPVIRLGLNPSTELSGGDAVGGAYHPALGELVRSRIQLDQMREQMKAIPRGSRVTVLAAPSRVSVMTGQHRINVLSLQREFGFADLRIRPDPSLSETDIPQILIAKGLDV